MTIWHKLAAVVLIAALLYAVAWIIAAIVAGEPG